MPELTHLHPSVADLGPRLRRRWLRLGLRGLMVLVLILAGGLGYVVHLARVQHDAVAAIDRTGGWAAYSWTVGPDGMGIPGGRPWAARWLVNWLGPDYFGHVVAVYLGGKATDADVAHVGRLPRLRSVQLDSTWESPVTRNAVTGAALVHLAGLTGLKDLQLTGIPVRDADLAALDTLTGLEMLGMSGTGITDAGLAQLGPLRNLFSLRLADNPALTGEGFRAFAAWPHLGSLDLGRTGVADLAVLPALPEVVVLYLDGTPLTDAGLAPVARMRLLLQLRLGNTQTTNAGLAHLRDLPNLQLLGLDRTAVTDEGLPTLAGLPLLASLNLAHTRVTDAGLARLAPTARFAALDLAGTSLTDEGARALGQFPRLAMLNLADTALSDAGLAHLVPMPFLKTLNTTGTRVTPLGLSQFRQARPGTIFGP